MTNPIINSSPDWELSIWTSIAFFAAYAVYLSVYRLWYSPIAHLPGPKLAALTQYYEFYHDTIRGSQYILSIEEMHKKYGPVVRINPWEVHVSDSDFHSELYTGSACHRHKWLLWEKHLGAPHSGLMSLGHDHHQMRRAPMDQFLSSKSVWDLQVIIENKANALLDRLRHEAKNPPAQPINVMYPLSAYTIDVINEIAFARNDHLIERSDFGAATTDSLLKATQVGSIAVHKNGAMASFNALPEAVLGRWVPGWSGWLKLKNGILSQIRYVKALQAIKRHKLDINHPMIFHERRSSELLPNLENETPHLAQDNQVLIQCGTLTTSWTLSLAIFHLCHRPETLRKLRNELMMAIPNAEDVVSLTQLQSLPYLGAVVKEALRHSVGTSSSISRIAADEPFEVVDRNTGKSYHIPAGTVISMSPYRTIMDESIFDDPLSFDPERWLQNYEKLDKYLIIFGGGDDYICVGQKLVQAELYLMLAKLFRRWGSASRVPSDDAVDTRKGNMVVFEITGTTLRNCSIPLPYEQSKGLYFRLQAF